MSYINYGISLIAQLVKNLPVMQETPVRFLGQEDLLEKGKGIHSSILGLPLWLSWERSKVKVFQSCPALCDRVDIPSLEFSMPEDWSG